MVRGQGWAAASAPARLADSASEQRRKGKLVTTDALDPRDSALADLLGIAEGGFDTVDPVGLGRSLAQVAVGTARHPSALARASARFLGGLMEASAATTARLVGAHADGPVGIEAKGPALRGRQPGPKTAGTSASSSPTCSPTEWSWRPWRAPRLNEPSASKARFAARLLLDAAAPTNQLFGQSASAAAGVRDRRPERLARRPPLPRGRGVQRRVASAGGHLAVHAGREHGRHQGTGGLPQRAGRADPIRAPDAPSARRSRCCSAHRGSTSTTSWTWRRGRAWSSGVSSTA